MQICAAVLCNLEKERMNLMGVILNVHICMHMHTCKFICVHKHVYTHLVHSVAGGVPRGEEGGLCSLILLIYTSGKLDLLKITQAGE